MRQAESLTYAVARAFGDQRARAVLLWIEFRRVAFDGGQTNRRRQDLPTRRIGRRGRRDRRRCRRGRSRDSRCELDVQVTSPSACERHVTVTISRADIDRYFDDAFGEMMPTAAVPGFRIGRAPRKVVENRFRDEVTEQVKSALLAGQPGADQRGAAVHGDQRAGLRSGSGRGAQRRADDVRVHDRGAAGVRPAEVEGPEAQAAGARVHRRRHRRAAGADAVALRPARAARRRGRRGRLCVGEHHGDGRRQAGRARERKRSCGFGRR